MNVAPPARLVETPSALPFLIGKEAQEMVKARVQLSSNGPATWSGSGYKFKRGESQIITRPADVLMFQNAGGFKVTIMEGTATPPPDRPPAATARPPNPDVTIVEEGEPVTGDFTRDDLEQQTKASLVQLAEEAGLDVNLDMSMKKSDMIEAILNAS